MCVSLTEALAFACLPSKAPSLPCLRRHNGGALPTAAFANRILAIGAPNPVAKMPRVVRDPTGVDGGLLLLLAQISENTFLAHPGGKRRGDGAYNYYVCDVRLVALGGRQRASLPSRGRPPSFPTTLRDVNVGPHASLKVASALAGCLVEIYFAHVAGRKDLDVSAHIDTNPLNWSDAALNRKLLLVWRDSAGQAHASVGPDLYTIVKHCSGASSSRAPLASPEL